MKDGYTLPLVVTGTDGAIVKAVLTNEKGFRKSLEHHELWVVHPETGRLLPDEEITSITKISDQGGWYAATVDQSSKGSAKVSKDFADSPGRGSDKESQIMNSSSKIKDIEILAELKDVIRQRHIDMPEGSYTTHLFEKGIEKIRKKLGEEAVELILAREHDEIVYESADLIYHILVYFEEAGIDINETFAELKKRH